MEMILRMNELLKAFLATCFAATPLTPILGEVADAVWDKNGTTGGQEKGYGSQVVYLQTLTSRFSFLAEGTGLAWAIFASPFR